MCHHMYNIIMVTQKEVRSMSPKTGRPTSNPKTHETRIRMSDEDVRMLEECCRLTGMTRADVIRKGIREVYEILKK